MGMSSVAYRGRQLSAPDGLLEIWLHAVAEEVGRLADPPPWLQELRQDWHDQATQGFGFGIVPNFDKWAIDKPRATVLVSLFQTVLHRYEQSGTEISGTRRDNLGLGGGRSEVGETGGYDVSEVIELGRNCIGLLKTK